MNMITRIAQLTAEGDVRVRFGFCTDHVKKIDMALERSNAQERFNLTIDLYKLWRDGSTGLAGVSGYADKMKEAEETFGEVFTKYGGRRMVSTVTADGKQLRVWYGLPGRMTANHVDSCGYNLLFEAVGDPQTVERYLVALTDRKAIKLPNGVRLFMNWS